ncbi:MAG: hypothetical protein R3291_05760, partial [Thermoplasmata archaeon]|nr:hypothetical protein [Thermoplasmata archaeon]
MDDGDARRVLTRAQRSLESQRFEEALSVIEEGQARFPENEKVRDLYLQIHLADGVRRHRRAQDLRRDDIRATRKKDRSEYRDGTEITRAFQEAIGSLDRVLAIQPDHAKALMLKAGVLDRM